MLSWGLVLSGGSAYGMANAGIVDVFEEHKLRPSVIAGSSMGAIVAALYATGHSAAAMRELAESIRLTTVASMSKHPLEGKRLHGGLLQQNIHTHLEPLLGTKRIRDCEIPFVCVAGRVIKPIEWKRIVRPGFTEYARKRVERCVFPPETRLIDALLATSAIPVLFSPHKIGTDEFVDLISFGAVPAKTLRETYHPDVIIATDTNPRYSGIKRFLPSSWQEFIADGLASMKLSLDASDLVIRPTLRGNPMRFDRAAQMIDAGREAALKKLPEIRKLIVQ